MTQSIYVSCHGQARTLVAVTFLVTGQPTMAVVSEALLRLKLMHGQALTHSGSSNCS